MSKHRKDGPLSNILFYVVMTLVALVVITWIF